jgi:hypothetical protein
MNVHSKRLLFHTLTLILMVLVAASLILWAWNTSLTTIFGLPSIHFKESISLATLALTFSMLIRPTKRRFIRFRGNRQ